MLLTEDQARKKWCPMVIADVTARERICPGTNLPGVNASRCIASDCMMWRWSSNFESLGFCGLAGRGISYA